MTKAPDYAAIGDLSVAFVPAAVSGLDADAVMRAQRQLSEIRRRVDACAAVVAAEIQYLSRPELGYSGLAQRLGDRTPEKLVARLAETSAREATTLVRVGALIALQDAGSGSDPARSYPIDDAPWLAAASAAVVAGRLSVEKADVIRAGLGCVDVSAPDGAALAAGLTAAVETLLGESARLSVEQLAARARELRAELDLDRTHDREQRLRDARYLRLMARSDGMTSISGLLDPESAAIVTSAVDAATSPRRGGPRFVDPAEAARADDILRDLRSTEQIALDAVVELVRIGGVADGRSVLGKRRPEVRVVVAQRDLASGEGVGFIEGQSAPISIRSVERHICASGLLPILFKGDGTALSLGRSQRYYSERQRVVLAVRDGGCRFPRCERPASWTEAHHADEWDRDGGNTDVECGILLCKHHHMLIHNNGWHVRYGGGEFWVIPPVDIDPIQTPIPAPSKSPALRRALNGSG